MRNMKHLECQLSWGGSPERESLIPASRSGDLGVVVAAQGRSRIPSAFWLYMLLLHLHKILSSRLNVHIVVNRVNTIYFLFA